MIRGTKLLVATLTLTAGLLALVEVSSAAPPALLPKPVFYVPKVAPVRAAGRPLARLPIEGIKPVPVATAVAGAARPSTPPSLKAVAVLSPAQKEAFVGNVNTLRASLGAAAMTTLTWDDN